MGVNKVIYGTETLIDLSSDTVDADHLAEGYTAHDKTGTKITGTMSGGGSSMNIQHCDGIVAVKTTSYSATDITLTVEKTGTYNVSWCGFRQSTSGTNGSQLYKNGAAYGSAQTTFTSSYGQSVKLTGVSLNQGDVLVVRARSRSTSYSMFVGNLVIEQTA